MSSPDWKTREGFATTADVALFRKGPHGAAQTLVIKRGGGVEKNKWAMPGGHIDPEDCYNLVSAASRELLEETGINTDQDPYPIYLRYIGKRESPDRQWIGHTFWGIVGPHHDLTALRAADDAAAFRWVSQPELDGLEVAFDHHEVLTALFEAARRTL